MQIVRKKDATNVSRPGGTSIWYYLFDEYELHYNEIMPGVTQEWHWHETIEEVIYIISGQMLVAWIQDGKQRREALREGDLVRSGTSIHTFINTHEDITRFVVFKLVLEGRNKREVFKTDKHVSAADALPAG